jgi:hypothetical protein
MRAASRPQTTWMTAAVTATEPYRIARRLYLSQMRLAWRPVTPSRR